MNPLLPDLSSPQFKANPYPLYARLRAEAPIYRSRLPLAGRGYLITRYADVVAVLKDERFANDWSARMPWILKRFARPITRSMLSRDPPDHGRLRALVHKAFTPRRIAELTERIESLSHRLLDELDPRAPFDLVSRYALPLPITIIADLLGVPAGDRHRFQAWSNSLLAVSSDASMVGAVPNVWRLIRYLRRLCRERHARPGSDLVSALVEVEEAGDRLHEEELVAMIFLLLIAGFETTTNLIASGTLALLSNPAARARFDSDPSVRESAIEELLRYTSPLEIGSVRIAKEDVKIESVTIALGEVVAPVLGSANHDEQQFADPDELDLGREPNRHVAFGHGAHFCLGAPLARLEGRIALTTLFGRLADLRLAQAPGTLRWRKSLILRGLESLSCQH